MIEFIVGVVLAVAITLGAQRVDKRLRQRAKEVPVIEETPYKDWQIGDIIFETQFGIKFHIVNQKLLLWDTYIVQAFKNGCVVVRKWDDMSNLPKERLAEKYDFIEMNAQFANSQNFGDLYVRFFSDKNTINHSLEIRKKKLKQEELETYVQAYKETAAK